MSSLHAPDAFAPTTEPLRGKCGLVVGVANQHSIAWACARRLAAAGMELAFTYQGAAMEDRVRRTVAELGDVPLYPLDVQFDDQLAALADGLSQRWGRLDFVLHSVAYAPREALAGSFLATSREAFRIALDVSAYSLVGLVRALRPLLARGASVVTLSYLGAERVVANYNVMGVAKAALEACVRYLSAELGPEGIRVNAVSAGPVNTLSARGIAHFREVLQVYAERAPLRRSATPEEIADAVLFLASPGSSGITAEVLHVDGGFHAVAF